MHGDKSALDLITPNHSVVLTTSFISLNAIKSVVVKNFKVFFPPKKIMHQELSKFNIYAFINVIRSIPFVIKLSNVKLFSIFYSKILPEPKHV